VLEIAGDLEELYLHHRADGLSDAEARRRVEETMDFSSQVLAEIVKVHASPYQRLLDQLSSRTRERWERVALLILGLCVCGMVAALAGAGPVFQQARPYSWPVLACFAGAVFTAVRQAHMLFFSGRCDARTARKHLGLLLTLGAAQPAFGLAGGWLSLIPLSWVMLDAGVFPGRAALDWMLGASALMVISFAGAILTAIGWLILAGRAALIEEAAADAMGAVNGMTEHNEERT
jgi:hypothetical protein